MSDFITLTEQELLSNLVIFDAEPILSLYNAYQIPFSQINQVNQIPFSASAVSTT